MNNTAHRASSAPSKTPTQYQPSTSRPGRATKSRSFSLLANFGAKVRSALSRSPGSQKQQRPGKTASTSSSLDSQHSSTGSMIRVSRLDSTLHDFEHPTCRPGGPDGTLDREEPATVHGPTISHLKRTMNLEANIQGRCIPALCEVVEQTVRESARVELRDGCRKGSNGDGGSKSMSLSTSTSFIMRALTHRSGTMCTPCVVVIGMIYLERLKTRVPQMRLTPSNATTLLAVAFLVASKFCEDHCSSNKEWARLAGLTLTEVNNLELDMLFALSFDLSVSPEECASFIQELIFPQASLQDEAAAAMTLRSGGFSEALHSGSGCGKTLLASLLPGSAHALNAQMQATG